MPPSRTTAAPLIGGAGRVTGLRWALVSLVVWAALAARAQAQPPVDERERAHLEEEIERAGLDLRSVRSASDDELASLALELREIEGLSETASVFYGFGATLLVVGALIGVVSGFLHPGARVGPSFGFGCFSSCGPPPSPDYTSFHWTLTSAIVGASLGVALLVTGGYFAGQAAARRQRWRWSMFAVAPTLTPVSDGAVVGVAGAF